METHLTIKHLAGYLPYGLKTQYKSPFSGDLKIKKLEIDSINYSLLNNDKPILRPLSDLTKEIEVNGEKFIPIECLFIRIENRPIHEDFYSYFLCKLEFSFKTNGPYDIIGLSFMEFQKLLEWHFDIYGLIEKGLAIDINTINK